MSVDLRELSLFPCLTCEFSTCHWDIHRRSRRMAHAKLGKLTVCFSMVVLARFNAVVLKLLTWCQESFPVH